MALFEQYGKDVQFIVVDVETEQGAALAYQYEVYTIPALFFLDKNGQVVDKHVGWLSREQLETKIKALME